MAWSPASTSTTCRAKSPPPETELGDAQQALGVLLQPVHLSRPGTVAKVAAIGLRQKAWAQLGAAGRFNLSIRGIGVVGNTSVSKAEARGSIPWSPVDPVTHTIGMVSDHANAGQRQNGRRDGGEQRDRRSHREDAGAGRLRNRRRRSPVERCEALAREVGGRAVPLDVADSDSVSGARRRRAGRFRGRAQRGRGAGAGAGLRCGRGAVATDVRDNVLGVMRVTKALLPALERSGDGHIVVIGSVAGVEVYPGGGGYTAAKHAANALCANAAPGTAGKADPDHRGCAWTGRDGVLAGALRRRRRASAGGVLGGWSP